MAITRTTLSADCTKEDLRLSVTSSTGAVVGQPMKVDDEYIGAIVEVGTGYVKVRGRGWEGTVGRAHKTLAPVLFQGAAGDFPAVPDGAVNPYPPDWPIQVTYGVSGAIAVPDKPALIELSKAGAAVMTLADPSKAQDGLRLLIMSSTAQAHTVTNTTGFNGGSTASDVATFGGAIGDNFEIVAMSGIWNVKYLRNVTLG